MTDQARVMHSTDILALASLLWQINYPTFRRTQMSMLRFAAVIALATVMGIASSQAQQTNLKPGLTPPTVQSEAKPNSPADRDDSKRAKKDSHAGVTVEQALVMKLKKANQAQIELAQLAQQKTDNQEVRQLAQTLIDEHQALNQDLKKIDMKSNAATSTNQSSQTPMVPHELCQIGEQACQNTLTMTKEMLNKHQGQDFNMAFLGQQCVAHTMMLGELKAIESDGPSGLRQFSNQAAAKVEKHLEKAKQLAKKLQDDSKPRS